MRLRCACEGMGETSGTQVPDYSGGIGGNLDNRNWDTYFPLPEEFGLFSLPSEDLISICLEVFQCRTTEEGSLLFRTFNSDKYIFDMWETSYIFVLCRLKFNTWVLSQMFWSLIWFCGKWCLQDLFLVCKNQSHANSICFIFKPNLAYILFPA